MPFISDRYGRTKIICECHLTPKKSSDRNIISSMTSFLLYSHPLNVVMILSFPLSWDAKIEFTRRNRVYFEKEYGNYLSFFSSLLSSIILKELRLKKHHIRETILRIMCQFRNEEQACRAGCGWGDVQKTSDGFGCCAPQAGVGV